MSLGIVIQARMGSTRLPNKMLLPFDNKKGILELLLDKLIEEFEELPLVLATTTSANDDAIEYLALRKGVSVYRGSEENVLSRFIEAGELYSFDKIIRVCADNPFLNIKALKYLIDTAKESKFDYISYCTSSNLPTIKTHFGFWAEIVSLQALKKVALLTKEQLYLEHVTNYIYEYSNDFSLNLIPIQIEIEQSEVRLTVDTLSDFETVKEVYAYAKAKNVKDIIDLLELVKEHPNWINKMNQQIIENSK